MVDDIDEFLTFLLKRMGLVTLFKRLDVQQMRHYVKIPTETYIEKICKKYLKTWLKTDKEKLTTPLPIWK